MNEVIPDPEDTSRSYPDQIRYLTQRLAETEQTLQSVLKEQAGASTDAQAASSLDTVSHTSLEGLGVIEEELRQHIEELTVANEELASTREAVEAERKRYQDLFDFAPDGYLVTDADGGIREANQAITILLNHQRRFLIGKPFVLYIAEQDRDEFRTRLAQLKKSRRNENIRDWEILLQPYQGDAFSASMTIAQASATAEGKTGLRWLIRDITKRKQAESDLHAASSGLENRVEQRTLELSAANLALHAEILERKRAEEALRESEEKFRFQFEQSSDGIALVDEGGVLIEWNAAFEKITGKRSNEVIGQPVWDVTFQLAPEAQRSPEYFQELKESITGALERAELDSNNRLLEHAIQCPDGSYRTLQTLTFPISTGRGLLVGIISRDITDRYRAEKERERLLERVEQEQKRVLTLAKTLARERDILQAVMENTRTQLAYLDSDFNFVRVNSAYAAGSGYLNETIIGHNHFELFPDEENQSIFKQARETGKPVEFQAKPIEFPDQPDRGTTYWDWSLVPVKDRQEQVQGFVLSLLEVTRRIRAEQALRKNQEELEIRVSQRTEELQQANAELQAGLAELKRVGEQLRLQTKAVEAAANGIIITDKDGTIRWCNPAFLEMTGFQKEEIIGQNPRILNSGQHPIEFHRQLWQTILSGKVWRGETINRRKDGSLYVEEQTIAPVIDEHGETSYFIAIKQDISERRRAEDLISQSAVRTETLALISQALVGASLDYHSILDIVSHTIADRIGDACTIWNLSEDEQSLTPVAHWDKNEGERNHAQDLLAFIANHPLNELGKGVFKIDRPILLSAGSVLEDSSRMELELSLHLSSRGVSSLLIVPMALQGKISGALSICRGTGGRPYNLDDQVLLQSLSDRIAMAIANVRQLEEIHRLYQSEVSQHKLAEALVQAAAALNASLNLDEVLDLILDQALLVIPAYGVNLMFVNGEFTNFVRFRGYLDPDRTLPDFSTTQTPLTIHQKEMVQTGNPVLVKDTSQDPDWVTIKGTEWLHSYMGVPLRSDNQTIGIINMDSESADYFNQESLQRLQALSEHAALAIHNARLYENLKTALKHEQAMRSQLIQAEKFSAMGRMIASVAHELNNPLQTIKNCLFLVQQELPTGFTVHEYLNIATAETQRISNLVLELREVYRPKEINRMLPIELGKLVEDIHTLIAPHLQSQRVGWQIELEPEPVYVNGIADQLKQVFLNICVNAIEAMQPGGGTIFVTLLQNQKTMRAGVSFRDMGPGIPKENLPLIFDPFFTTKENGTGLGLPISYEIIRHHGGEILVKSKPGEGAEFTIWLPLFE